MTTLAPAHDHVEALTALFAAVVEEGVMCLDAGKESNYVASDRRLARSGRPPTGRWAILDGDGLVVGYLTGRFAGRIPEADIEGAFIRLIFVTSAVRGAGHAWTAVREFARRAREDVGATAVGLRLDEVGDIDARRARFLRIGFKFDGLIGTARIEELLSVAGEPR